MELFEFPYSAHYRRILKGRFKPSLSDQRISPGIMLCVTAPDGSRATVHLSVSEAVVLRDALSVWMAGHKYEVPDEALRSLTPGLDDPHDAGI